jgi:hypothetical protein
MGNTKVNEVWRSVDGYENIYEVSNFGNVKSLERTDRLGRIVKEKILKTIKHNCGYLKVHLSKNNVSKKFYIHRLVANAFLINDNNYPEVNHEDGDKHNNNLENLKWVTCSDNIKHAFANGLNRSPKAMLGKFGENHNRSKAVIQYDLEGSFVARYGSMSEANRETGVKVSSISNCCRGTSNKSGGYIWRYE